MIDPFILTLAAALAGVLMVRLGQDTKMLEVRQPRRICPSCGRDTGAPNGCSCLEPS